MRIVSAFRQAPERAIQTLIRFPIVLLAGAFLAGVIIADLEGAVGERLLMTAMLAIVLAFDLTLVTERIGQSGWLASTGVFVLTAGVLAAVFWSVDLIGRDGVSGYGAWMYSISVDDPIRIAAIALSLHAFAAVIPFLGRRSVTGFWDYNRTLFLRILSSCLFSGVLYAGLAGALLAIDNLLTIDVENQTYTHLFAVMAGVVNTWFFLAGVPAARLQSESEEVAASEAVYPRGLKVFVQFVLLPLTAVYLVILYLYTARILLEWNLPEGQVSYLIFSYAVMGILAYLLIHPLRDDEENNWIRTFARGFFIALAPLLIVLAVALMRRVNDYGLTEPRYYGLALAVWLAIIVGYFLTRREDIRIIPITLAVASLLTIAGPWGATAVAVRSQVAQFEEIVALPKPLTEVQQTSVRSIAQFLAERGRLADAAGSVTARPDTITSSAALVAAAGVDPAWLSNESQDLHFSFTSATAMDVRGYSDMIDIPGSFDSMAVTSATLGSVRLRWSAPGLLEVSAAGSVVVMRLDSVAAALMQPIAITRTEANGRNVERSIATDSAPEAERAVVSEPAPETEPQRATARPRESSAPTPKDPSRPGVIAPRIEVAGSTLRARLVLRWLTGSRRSDSTASASDLSAVLLIGPALATPTTADTSRVE